MLQVDFTEFVILLFNSLFDIIYNCFVMLDSITILDGSRFGWSFSASLLDFMIGITLTGIILGALVHINRPDDFYSER